MQAVSGDYLTAIVAPVRQIKQTVNIDFMNNQMLLGTIEVTANEGDPEAAPAAAVADGKDVIHYLYALADPFDESDLLHRARMYPSDTLFPLPDGIIWFGQNLSDDSNEISDSLFITYYTSMTINSVRWVGDDWLGRPVDFWISYVHITENGPESDYIAKVTGWDKASWSISLDTPITVDYLIFSFFKMNLPRTSAKLVEFEGSFSMDATVRVGQWEIIEERNADSQTAPLGNASSNQITLELDNTDNLFYRKSGSLYAPYLVANRRIKVQCGVVLESGDPELVPVGTFYTVSWNADLASPTARVVAWDRSKLMKETNFASSDIYFNQTVSELVKMLCFAFDLTNDDMVIDDTTDVIPYAWFEDDSYWNHLIALAEAEGGQIYFDEQDRLVFENRSHLADHSTPVASLADDDTIIGVIEGWDQSKMRNDIQVTPKALQPDVVAHICNLNDVLTVPASGTLVLTLNFSNSPCINVQTPVITGGVDISITGWTAYAWGGILTLANSAGADETVTAITVDGQPLKESGGIEGHAEDAILIQLNGRRTYPIESRLIQSQAHAQALAEALLPVLSNPGAQITVASRGRPELQLADALATAVDRMGIAQNYWLLRNRMTYDGGLAAELTLQEIVEMES
jgi:hypothetical protein